MKAVVFREYGPPAMGRLEEWTVGSPAPDEVQVRVDSAGVTFVDTLIAAGGYQMKPALPFVPGSEFSGEVIAVGRDVAGIAVGDLVCGGNQTGIFAERLNLPAVRIQKLPPGVAMAQAAVLRASYLTAWHALVDRGALKAGDTVLILGAAGAVGTAACQIVRHFGARVIASASSAEKRSFAIDNSASHAIDSAATDWRQRIRELTEGRGVDIVFDPVGGAATERAFRALAWGGRHLVVGFAAGTIPALPTNLALLKGGSLVGVDAGQYTRHAFDASQAVRAEIMALFAAGVLTPRVGASFALDDFAAAMELASRGTMPGRVLIRMPGARR